MNRPLPDTWWIEILLPRTDAGVAFQALVVLVVFAGLWWPARRLSVLTLWRGLLLFTIGLFGLRTLH